MLPRKFTRPTYTQSSRRPDSKSGTTVQPARFAKAIENSRSPFVANYFFVIGVITVEISGNSPAAKTSLFRRSASAKRIFRNGSFAPGSHEKWASWRNTKENVRAAQSGRKLRSVFIPTTKLNGNISLTGTTASEL